jgi:predicted hydrocarbon binding protein
MVMFENLYHVAWDETKKLKASANGLRVAIHGLSSLIRDFGVQSALKFIISQVDFLKRQGAIVMSTINPDTVSHTDLATFEDSSDGIIELTVKEEKMRFQRYIRVKSSPLALFRQERLPYEIVGTNLGISTGSKITEDFASFRANLKMNTPGILDILGDRSYIQSVRVITKLYMLLFEELGYDKAMELMYRVGAESVAGVTREYSEKLRVDIDSPNPDLPELAKTFFGFVAMAGYGELELVSSDLAKNVILFRLFKSPVAQTLAGFGKPVDAYVSGCIAGGLKLLLGGNIVCEETLCVSRGDNYCEFKARRQR